MARNTAQLYNQSFREWVRRSPTTLSDFTGRPAVFDACRNVSGKLVLDLGCGEGYCARELIKKGAKSVHGIDISENMIEAANFAKNNHEAMNFEVGNITSLPKQSAHYDIAIGVFVYNYLNKNQTAQSFREVFRVLKEGGKFIFSVPHPAFPFIWRKSEKPFYFAITEGGYFTNQDKYCNGEIWKLDNNSLPVEMYHKLISDYFDMLGEAGFDRMPKVKELGVDKELMQLHPDFFAPIYDVPLHLLIEIQK